LVSSCSLFTICKKHQVATIDELLEIQAQLENSVFELGNLEGEIKGLTSIQENNTVR
jgi:DNA repair protein RecN (Recombination protein N)